MTRKTVIGVTGLPCAGKSLAAECIASGEVFGQAGEVVKADDLGHAVLELPEIREALRRRFGGEIFRDSAPAAIRREIAARVFTNPEALAWLEALVHPHVLRETEKIIARTVDRPVAVEAALLFAGKLDGLCDAVVVVEAPFEVRARRAARRNWSREELERRERRLLPLFSPESLAARGEKIIRILNDQDGGALGERLQSALTKYNNARKDNT